LNVVFVLPYALESTLRFVRGALSLPGVRLAVLSQEPVERLPADLRGRLAGHWAVADALDPDQLVHGVRALASGLGGRVDRLLGILEQLQVPLGEARERLGVRGMDASTAQNFRDKARMKEVLAAAELPCASHCLAESAAEALRFAERVGFPLVIKPPAGAGARDTFRVDREADLSGLLESSPPLAGQPVLLEEFVTGREHSFDSVSIAGRHVFHSISEYHPSPLEVMRTPWIQWSVFLPRDVSGPEFADIGAAGPRALDALGMVTGMTHMEWFRRADGSLLISEVAARPPGAQFTTLLGYAHDRDFYREWAHVSVFETFDPPERRYACGAAFLRGQGSGRVSRVAGLEEAQRRFGSLVVEARLPRPGQAAAGGYEGEGWVILRHPDDAVIRNALSEIVRLVQVEYGGVPS